MDVADALERGLYEPLERRIDKFAATFAHEITRGRFDRALVWASMAEITVENAIGYGEVREDA